MIDVGPAVSGGGPVGVEVGGVASSSDRAVESGARTCSVISEWGWMGWGSLVIF